MLSNSSQSVPQIAGVNMATALSRLAGNAKLLFKLFGDFRTQNHDMVRQVQEKVDAQDYETAQRLLHTVKGVAANLAMDDLSEAAKVAEYALRENKPEELPPALVVMQAKLDEVCGGIEQALAVQAAAQAATTATAATTAQGAQGATAAQGAQAATTAQGAQAAPAAASSEILDEHAKRAFAETIRLSARQSPDAAFVFETVRETLHRNYPRQASAIAGHLDNYAFGEALKELQRLAVDLKLTM